MATTTAVGGSQIDVVSLVSQLVAAERAPLDKQVARDTQRVTTQISAVGTLMGAISTFRSSLASLKTVDVFSTRGATTSNEEVFTATAGASAVPGTYEIEVDRLATAHQISSNAFANGSSHVVGTGTLTLSQGSESFSLTIDSSNNTLSGIRDAINSASNNPGIRATLISGAGGSRLVLTSAEPGAANAISVSQTGGDGGLSALTYSAGAPGNYAQIAAAQDARVFVANATITSATNTITNAIDGVTLTLNEANQGEKETLTVNYDKTSVTTRINNFVQAYNTLAAQMTKLRGYDAATKTAGPMLGDSLLTGIEAQIRRTITDAVSAGGNYQTLASIGITTQANGQLAVDNTKLQKALDTDFGAVGKLFGSEQGIGARLFAQMDDRLKADGALETRSDNLVKQQKAIEDRKAQIDVRMASLQQGYLKQFTRLDTLLSSLQVTSSYLTQQIESLGNLNKASSS